MIVTAPRASAILYHVLRSRADRRPFLLPANICPVVPLTFLKAGVPFAFADLDPASLNLDLARAAPLLQNGQFGGLLYAHTYGDESTPVEFFAETRRRDKDLLVIDDRCLCMPEMEPDPDNPADVLLYSTGYAKMVDIGSGGYAFLRPGMDYRPQALSFRQADLDAVEQAYKASLTNCQPFHYHDSDWLQAGPIPAWETYRLQIAEAVPRSRAHRREINATYAARLPAEICLPDRFQLWRFTIRVDDKFAVLKAIFDAELFASSHYASLAGVFTPGSCPQAEELAGHVINLFNDHHYTVKMAERTCDIIRRTI